MDDSKKLIEMATESYRGSACTQRMIVREIKASMNFGEFGSVVGTMPVSSDPTVQKRMPNLLQSYQASIHQNEIAKGILEANHALIKGTIATATILAAPTGAGAIAMAGTSWVLDQSMAAATKVFDEHASKEARTILGHQLANYSRLNPGIDLAQFKGMKPEEVFKILEDTSPIFDPALGEVKVEDRDLVQWFYFREIQKTIVSGNLHLLNQFERNADEIQQARTEVAHVGKVLVNFAEKTNKELGVIRDVLGEIKDDVQTIYATSKENQRDLRFIQNLMFGKMTVSEQRAALKAGMRDDLSKLEQAALDHKLKLVEKQEKLHQDVQEFFGGASTLIGLASNIPGFNPKLLKNAKKAVEVGQAAFAIGTALASCNYLQAASVISGLLSGGASPETQRHKQIMDKLGEISGQIDALSQKVDIMLNLQKQTMDGLKVIYKGIVELSKQIADNHAATINKLDRLHQDVLYNRAILVDQSGIRHCDTFLDARRHYGFDGQDFASYQNLRSHFEANPNPTLFWEGFKALLNIFSITDDLGVNKLLGMRALEGRTEIEHGVMEPIRVWRETVYEPLLAFVDARLPVTWTKDAEAFFSMFLLPARRAQDLIPEPTLVNIGDPLLLETSMSSHMKFALSPITINHCANYLMQLFPYLGWVRTTNGPFLYSIQELVAHRDQPVDTLILREALTIVEIAIAQQALLGGHLMLPLFDRCYAMPVPNDPATDQDHANMLSSIQDLLVKNSLLRRNWIFYKFNKQLQEKGTNLSAYYFACQVHTDDSLWKTLFSFPWIWNWRKTDDGKRDWWHVQIGNIFEPIPSFQELEQGLLEYGDEMTMLLQLRSRMIGELANYDFSDGLDASTRDVYVAALLHSV